MLIDYTWHDALGNLGVVLIVGSYFLLQIGRIAGSGSAYAVINGCGAALVLLSLYFDFNLSAALIEIFWLLISVLGLLLKWARRSEDRPSSP
jgi:hypothetical protein